MFCAIAPFVTARPYEMVRNDMGYMHQNVKLVGRNCGMTYSDLGATHQSLDDFALIEITFAKFLDTLNQKFLFIGTCEIHFFVPPVVCMIRA